MKIKNLKREKRARAKARVRARIFGTSARPRLSVFRSSSDIYAQIINDEKGVTLESSSSLTIKRPAGKKKQDHSFLVGEELAKKAVAKGIAKVSFDNGGYRYHGRVKALADGARAGGLQF
jgi:large subunit ribosomal protein L18